MRLYNRICFMDFISFLKPGEGYKRMLEMMIANLKTFAGTMFLGFFVMVPKSGFHDLLSALGVPEGAVM